MTTFIKIVCNSLAALTLVTGSTWASQVMFTMDMPGGFDVSINGGPLTPSGPILVRGIVDTSTVDLNASTSYGEFPLMGATFTGAGFLNRAVTTPLSLLTYNVFGPQMFAFQLTGQFNAGIMGWNGSSSTGNFMGDVNNLGTLFPLPFTTVGTSTYWYDALGPKAWTLALGGDTVGASVGVGGPTGTFSISVVPEPASLALAGLGVAALLFRRAKRPTC